jgi:hypothetical protein
MAGLRGMYCLKDKWPFHIVKDSFIAIFWFRRYRFWNLLFRCWMTGYILRSLWGPWYSFCLLLSAKCIHVITTYNLSRGNVSKETEWIPANSLSKKYRFVYNVHQHNDSQNYIHFLHCNIFSLPNPELNVKGLTILKFLAELICLFQLHWVTVELC